MKPGNEPGEDLDTRKVHGALMREKAEPYEMYNAAPWWLKHLIYFPISIWALCYLVIASGGFRWDEYSELPYRTYVPENTGEEKSAPASDDPKALIEEGKTLFATVCAACHQADGKGLPGAFPPLAGSDWISGSEERPILTVLHGLSGEITVSGEKWNSVMPPQGETLDDHKIAAVLSYVRSEWGDSAPPVTPESVAALREKYQGHAPWTEADLDKALTE